MDALISLAELSLGSRLMRVSDLCMKVIKQVYRENGIDFDPYLFPAFHEIATRKTTTNTLLCETLQATQPSITQTINKLLKRELIEINVDEYDKRKKIISISSKGDALLTKIKPLWEAMDLAVKKHTQLPADSLIDHIGHFEKALKSGALLTSINQNIRPT